MGVLALTPFAYFVLELRRGHFTHGLTVAAGLLFGPAVASAPIGKAVFAETLWPWFVTGEATTWAPLAKLTAYVYAIDLIRDRKGMSDGGGAQQTGHGRR